jgi:hypothetical protein
MIPAPNAAPPKIPTRVFTANLRKLSLSEIDRTHNALFGSLPNERNLATDFADYTDSKGADRRLGRP